MSTYIYHIHMLHKPLSRAYMKKQPKFHNLVCIPLLLTPLPSFSPLPSFPPPTLFPSPYPLSLPPTLFPSPYPLSLPLSVCIFVFPDNCPAARTDAQFLSSSHPFFCPRMLSLSPPSLFATPFCDYACAVCESGKWQDLGMT